MPVTSAGYVIQSADDRALALRAQWLATFGYEVADDSIEAGIIDSFADLAYDLDSGGQVLWDAMSAFTASGAQLDRWFAGRPARRPGTPSRYTVTVDATTGTVSYPAGSIVRGGGAQWQVVTTTLVSTGTPVVIEALDDGPIALPSVGITTLQLVTPVTGIDDVEYDPALAAPFQIGTDRETDAQYRARGLSVRGSAAGTTYPGLRARLLLLPWVRAAALARVSPGTARITVFPAPVGADQTAQLAEAIVYGLAWGLTSSGSNTAVVALPDGGTDTARWEVGSDDAVTVAVQVVLSGVSLADVRTGIEEAIRGVVAALNVGEILRYARLYVAVASVPGVVGIASLTINSSPSDYTPLATDLVVLAGTPSVTT